MRSTPTTRELDAAAAGPAGEPGGGLAAAGAEVEQPLAAGSGEQPAEQGAVEGAIAEERAVDPGEAGQGALRLRVGQVGVVEQLGLGDRAAAAWRSGSRSSRRKIAAGILQTA